jgi:hypothetical protein
MNFKFQRLLGAPYRGGNALFWENELFTPAGNRVNRVDLTQVRAASTLSLGALHSQASSKNMQQSTQTEFVFLHLYHAPSPPCQNRA